MIGLQPREDCVGGYYWSVHHALSGKNSVASGKLSLSGRAGLSELLKQLGKGGGGGGCAAVNGLALQPSCGGFFPVPFFAIPAKIQLDASWWFTE